MAGQIIILPGVRANAANGARRIDMTNADQIAARMPSLINAVSARTLTAGAEGVSGRCRATGGVLTMIGSNQGAMTITPLGGKPAIVLTSVTASAALLMPSGSWTASNCVVAAIYVGPGIPADSAIFNMISGYNGTTYAASQIRGYGGASSNNHAGHLVNTLAVSSAVAARVQTPAPGWAIVMSALDANTGSGYISVNGGDVAQHTVTTPVVPSNPSAARTGIGYTTSSGMRDCGVGDVFVLNASMRGSAYERDAIDSLVLALKSQYNVV